jgi:hypothetical protein
MFGSGEGFVGLSLSLSRFVLAVMDSVDFSIYLSP